jgi:glycosyltransferase involved in cell wall biosynthesis
MEARLTGTVTIVGVKVSLVATVKDARPHIEEFLASLRAQTREPDEVIVVDGGSTDGTWEILEAAEGIQAISEPGANIARGRNLAIRAAAHDVIAVTDADCVLDTEWLRSLISPIEAGADVSAGFYRAIATSPVTIWSSAASIPDRDEVRPGWMPSSRSIAFKRGAFDTAGGYPEWLDLGEDMFLDHRFVQTGARIDLSPGAVVQWRPRPTMAATWRQYAGYAEGDAIAGMYPERHLIRFGVYAFLVAALATRSRLLIRLAALGGIAYARRPLRRAWRRLEGRPGPRAAALVGVPLMMAFIDLAKMWGYIRGRSRAAEEFPHEP